MIRINLLPHRELRRAAQKRAFGIAAAVVAGIGALIVIIGQGWLSGRLDEQNSRNSYLEQQISSLDKQIDEIRKLKEATAALLARKTVVESLQDNRGETVHLLDQLARLLPEGVYLKSVKQTGKKVSVIGFAQSSARVSTLMRNLETSPLLEYASLVEIKAVDAVSGGGKDKPNNIRRNEFNLNLNIKQANPEEGEKVGKAPKKVSPR